jgi:hypothetical protein
MLATGARELVAMFFSRNLWDAAGFSQLVFQWHQSTSSFPVLCSSVP